MPPNRAPPKLRNLAVLIYATLVLLAFTMPEEIQSRLDDLPSSPVVHAAQVGVGAMVAVSNQLGVAQLYRTARQHVLDFTGLSQI